MTAIYIGAAVGIVFGVLRYVGAMIRIREERDADNVVTLRPKP